jgi:hypothetical protein
MIMPRNTRNAPVREILEGADATIELLTFCASIMTPCAEAQKKRLTEMWGQEMIQTRTGSWSGYECARR